MDSTSSRVTLPEYGRPELFLANSHRTIQLCASYNVVRTRSVVVYNVCSSFAFF